MMIVDDFLGIAKELKRILLEQQNAQTSARPVEIEPPLAEDEPIDCDGFGAEF